MKKNQFTAIGALVGAVFGYPISYYFQPGALRAKLPMGGYIEHISDILSSKELQSTAIGTWIVAVVVFAIIGFALGNAADQKK